MEYQKLTNLLDKTPDNVPRFITTKQVEVHDESGKSYSINKQIRFKTSMIRSNLNDYSDAYIVVKRTITIRRLNNNAFDKKLAFKNNVPFISRMSKTNNVLIDNAEDLDVVMPMYNFIEYSKNYSKTSGSLWNHYRDKPNVVQGGADNNITYSIKDSKSFDYQTKIKGKLEGTNGTKDVEIIVSLTFFL